MPPVITGVGLVTPLGRSAAATWTALLEGRHTPDHARLTTVGPAGLSRVSALAVEAGRAALAEAEWSSDADLAVVACTSKGPVEDWMRPVDGTSDNVGRGVAPQIARHGYGMSTVAAAVSEQLGLGSGPRLTVSAACAGGLQALIRACLLLCAGEADRVLVVAAEASVHPMFLASFGRLGVLPRVGETCRPFDLDRRGFFMSEAAAAVCLERPPAVGVAVGPFGLGGDASHLTGSDPTGQTLRRLIAHTTAGLAVDLVHAHGTGTVLNDAAELAALNAGLPNGGDGSALYSHKAAVGHTLGASGLVAVVLSVLAHRSCVVPPNVNTRRPMPTALRLSTAAEPRPIRRSLVTAAGFGGGVAAVRLDTT